MRLTGEQEEAIRQLYIEMYHPLCAYAMSALRNRSIAEEAVQDTFRIACAKPNALLNSQNPKGWLMLTLKNVIQNIRHSHMLLSHLILTAIPMEEVAAEPSYENLEFNILCADCVGKKNFTLLKLIALYNCTILEASQQLGISVEACKKRVQRTKKKLREMIREMN